MRSRLLSILLVVSLLFLAGAVVYSTTRPSTGRKRAAREVLQIGTVLNPRMRRNDIVGGSTPGSLGFRLGPEETLLGVSIATVFPIKDGRPVVGRSVECSAAQVDGRLDLRRWLHECAHEAELHWLHFGLVLRTSKGEEVRAGWSPLRASDLKTHALDVDAGPREGFDVRVVVADGQRIPGALVAIDVAPYDPGPLSLCLHTGPDGTMRVSGYEDAEHLVAALPHGAGPHTHPVRRPFSPSDGLVELVVPVRGRWEFSAQMANVPIAGASLRIEQLSTTGGAAPGAWPVASWLAPGHGGRTPFYLMFPWRAGKRKPLPARIKFHGYEEFRIGNARGSHGMTFPLADSNVEVRTLPDAHPRRAR